MIVIPEIEASKNDDEALAPRAQRLNHKLTFENLRQWNQSQENLASESVSKIALASTSTTRTGEIQPTGTTLPTISTPISTPNSNGSGLNNFLKLPFGSRNWQSTSDTFSFGFSLPSEQGRENSCQQDDGGYDTVLNDPSSPTHLANFLHFKNLLVSNDGALDEAPLNRSYQCTTPRIQKITRFRLHSQLRSQPLPIGKETEMTLDMGSMKLENQTSNATAVPDLHPSRWTLLRRVRQRFPQVMAYNIFFHKDYLWNILTSVIQSSLITSWLVFRQ